MQDASLGAARQLAEHERIESFRDAARRRALGHEQTIDRQ
jgi:hypothetical protein